MKLLLPILLALGFILAACAGSSQMQLEDFPTLPPDTDVFTLDEVDVTPSLDYEKIGIDGLRRSNERLVRSGFEGSVEVRYVVTPEGRAKNIEVLESAVSEKHRLAAMQNVYELIFKPGILNGEAVHTQSGHTVELRATSFSDAITQ